MTQRSRRQTLKAGLAVAVAGVGAGAALLAPRGLRAQARTALKFSLNAPFDGSNAAFFLAEQQGYFRAEGLDVQMDASGGTGETITRVSSGAYDAGFGDQTALVEFIAKNPAVAPKAVQTIYYRSPLCIGTVAKAGVATAKDLVGKTLSAAQTDGAFRLFPAFCAQVGITPEQVNFKYGDLRIREALLLRGEVDGIVGFDSTIYFNLVPQGIKPEDLRFLYYADHGLDIYGNSILVSRKLLDGDPAIVRGLVRAIGRGWRAAIKDPEAAIAALAKRDPLIKREAELGKLQWLIKNQLVTDEVRRNGMGDVVPERLARAVATVSQAFGLAQAPAPGDVFTNAYLPPPAERMLG
jgi:NitT/TauT family transport system substrate-binding protein